MSGSTRRATLDRRGPRGAVGRWPLSTLAGGAAILVYLACTAVAWWAYPAPYDPVHNWLSDLGDAAGNPGGALAYNLGVAVSAVALALFFAGLGDWAAGGPPRLGRRLAAAQAIGIASCAAMVGTALVPLSADAGLHGWLAMVHLELLAFACALAGAFLYRRPGFWRPVAWLGAAAAVEAVLFGFAAHAYALEWLGIVLVIGYVAAMAANLRAVGGESPGRPGRRG